MHRFDAVIKGRSLQGDGCLICSGYLIDETNSLLTWFPDLAIEIDDPALDPSILPTSRHNASGTQRRDGAYSLIDWRCGHGHVWSSTISNRVQGGGCPQCSTAGTSKEQVRAVAEISGLLELVPPDRSDPRLPIGVPDFGSNKIEISAALKPPGWRYGQLEIDARFRHSKGLVALEYDGSYHHSTSRRDRTEFESAKDKLLVELGYVPVRIRVGNLPQLDSPAIICAVPEGATPFESASAVIQSLERIYPGQIDGAETYTGGGVARRQDLANSYITAVWGELRPRRRIPRAKSTTAKARALKATNPHPDSQLTPTGPPYRNPDLTGPTLRDYQCQCGVGVTGAVQSQVTSGNTRSCGCLAQTARTAPRVHVDRHETAAARQWARERGIPIRGNGRVPARIVASHRLWAAGRMDLINADGLIDEDEVRKWALTENVPLLARGRLSEEAMLGYAARYGLTSVNA